MTSSSSPLRIAMPVPQGRGAGLGNEIIAWGRAYVAAQVLGLRLVHPAWGLNTRAYHRYFGTSRLDWALHWSLRKALPVVPFTEDDFRRAADLDLDRALRDFADRHGLARRRAFVLTCTGMWGGFRAIEGAREFLRAQLLSTRGACSNLYRLDRRYRTGGLRIGFHIRRGDFAAAPPPAAFRNRFNAAIPIDWYVAVARKLVDSLPPGTSFLVVSDGSARDLQPLTSQFPCVLTSDLAETDISDLLALAACDLIVCSISSFSLAAAFLSSGRYLWLAANLNTHGDLLSIWGHETAQAEPRGETARNLQAVRAEQAAGRPVVGRGVAVGWDGDLPAELLADLERRALLAQARTDLVRYGVTPVEK